MQTLDKITAKPDFWHCDETRTQVLPFPGKFPTRWFIRVSYKDKLLFHYKGKPSPLLIAKMDLQRRRFPGLVELYEFDRMGTFRYFIGNTPRNHYLVAHCNPHVSYFYYPWNLYNNDFFYPWLTPIYHKKGILKGHSFFFYSPYKEMIKEDMIDLLRQQRTWLRKVRLWR